MKKRFFAFLMMICLLIPCAIFVSACGAGNGGTTNSGTENGSQGGNEGDSSSLLASPESYFVFDSYTNEINGLTDEGKEASKIVIPSEIGGRKVEKIGYEAFIGCTNLTSVVVPDTVQTFNDGVFKGCTALTRVVLPKNLKRIERELFSGCTSLSEVTIPDTVESIRSQAFYDCSSLKEITIPSSVQFVWGSAFIGCSDLGKVNTNDFSAWCQISFDAGGNPCINSHNLYVNGKELGEEVTIPGTVETIGKYAFHDCNLTTLTLGEGLKSIGWEAFRTLKLSQVNINAIDLTLTASPFAFDSNNTFVVTFGANVEKIPAYLFKCTNNNLEGEYGVSQVNISGEITTIGEYAFYKQKYLSSVTIPKSVTTIEKEAFNGCAGLTTLTFESDSVLATIREKAFLNCTSLTEIQIPKNVTTIEKEAFKSCTSLTTLTFEENCLIETIGENAFQGCSALNGLVVPKKLKTIGGYAFDGCTSLATLTFENDCTLQKIEWYAFSGCSSLTKFSIPTSVKTIASYAFDNCTGLTKVFIPGSLTTCSMPFRGCRNLTIYCNIMESEASKKWYDSWCLYYKDNNNSYNNLKCNVVYATSLPED